MTIQDVIRRTSAGQDLTKEATVEAFTAIMQGETTPAQIAALLVALRMKGETVEEIAGAASVMRDKAQHITPADKAFLIDTCGTGGDKSNTFNISTATAFVACGAGAHVAKHGNRSISSQSGSADVLEALGVTIGAPLNVMQECLDTIGICFMFAPAFHGAMKHAIGPRKEIGIRTIFNILGPLTNPAGAANQLLGVFAPELTQPLAHVLQSLGSKHVFVVHGLDGLDEISLCERTRVSELKDGKIATTEIAPEDFGFSRVQRQELGGGTAAYNAGIIREILDGEKGPARDIVVLNAGFAIAAAGCASTPAAGVAMAAESIDSGAAAEKLRLLAERTA